LRITGAVDAIRIVEARIAAARGNPSVPYIRGAAGQIVACNFLAAHGIEQAEFDSSRMARKERKIDALLGPGGAQRSRRTRLNDLHFFKSPASLPKYAPHIRARFDRLRNSPCSSN
jgi:hypothetical protein